MLLRCLTSYYWVEHRHARAHLLRTQHTQDLTFAGVTGVIGSATVGVGEGPGTGAGTGSVTGSFVTGTSGGVTGGTTGFAVATTGGVTGASVAVTTTGGVGPGVAGTGGSATGGTGACCVVQSAKQAQRCTDIVVSFCGRDNWITAA
jgi:hypothetical protein